ncbi:MAG: radical SAM protein [Vicinamibacteria bacterium]|nr:radical SAM protein [Vicinamibacteria bacterium]
MSTAFARVTGALRGLLGGDEELELRVGPEGPAGPIGVPNAGDGRWQLATAGGQPVLTPAEDAHYLYFTLPERFRERATAGLWLEIEYHGASYARFRVQYASADRGAEFDGLYKGAEQRWSGSGQGLAHFRRALFPLPDFAPDRLQNHDASFRVEFREDVKVRSLRARLAPPSDLAAYPVVAPLPELRKLPGRFYPINYLFIEITNACNFKCTWCPDDIMGRKRGFMKKQKAFRILDEIAEKRPRLGPLYPVKLHQMGEPFLHPDLAEIVAHAESRGVGIELNTNCGLLTEKNVDALYDAGLTNLILSYQTPDAESFKTRKAPSLKFDAYRDKVRMAVERKVAKGARTRLEIDIMNTKHADGYAIVSEDEQAKAFLRDWISFTQELEQRHGLAPREHDWATLESRAFLDADENGSRYDLLDGVTLIWKRCHSWGNVIGGHRLAEVKDTYCPAPYDQFVIQWNGDVVSCCTDYEGGTKIANVFRESIESVWTGEALKRRKQDMLEGRLLDVCAKCIGVK